MRPVWLNDELMVSPSAVAGLRAAHVTSGMPPEWWYVVDVLFVGGSQARVAEVRELAEAQAEVERLSELLWPEPWGWPGPVTRCGATEPRPLENRLARCVLGFDHRGEHEF